METILDIDGWLGGIGLAQYGELFRANDIDGELLRRLTGDVISARYRRCVAWPSQEAAGCDRDPRQGT